MLIAKSKSPPKVAPLRQNSSESFQRVGSRQSSSESFQKAVNNASRQNSSESFQKVRGVSESPATVRQNSDPKSEFPKVKITELIKEEAKVPAKVAPPPKKIVSPPQHVIIPKESTPSPKVTSPPVLISKLTRVNSIAEEKPVQKSFKPDIVMQEAPRVEKPAFAPTMPLPVIPTEEIPAESPDLPAAIAIEPEKPATGEENNGVGDKIKIFEKAAENAATAGRLSRPGSMRRPRTERLPSDELPPPPPPAELSLSPAPLSAFERQPSLTRAEFGSARWPRSDGESDAEPPRPRPEPQRIIRPEFRQLASPAEVTIRSPSLGAKIPERFTSHGTAFRNVAATTPAPVPAPVDETEEHHKACKTRGKYSVSRGSSYFTRGSEEIWLVKKKDIEEIEERVLDSFRRSGGPPSNSGAATLGRGRRQMYARSESLEPTSVGRAHTLKRQTSVACTCGHDKKTRARSADSTAPPRARSRSHGDDAGHAHVLDKYETLV